MFFHPRQHQHPEFRIGFNEMANVALGIAAWGLMTGVAMVKAGMGTATALFMILTVFAGSAQLATTPLILAGAPMWVVLATAFCVNLRFVVFSAHLRAYVMHLPRWERLMSGYFTGDLSYVLLVKRFPTPASSPQGRADQMAYLAGSCSINWLSWMVCSVIGVILANFIPSSWGLGFAGILALVGMLCSLAGSRLRVIAVAVASGAAVLAFALPLKLNILVSIAAAVVACLSLETRLGLGSTAPQKH